MSENRFLHAECGQLARRDLNGLDYTKNTQTINCEGCGVRVERHWQHTDWTIWRTRET